MSDTTDSNDSTDSIELDDIEDIGVATGDGESWPEVADRLRRRDDDRLHYCICGEGFKSRGSALLCCSERFADVDEEIVTDGGLGLDDVVHELTDRPVEDLPKAALKAEWSEAYERIASGTVEDREAAWDRRHELWQEMRERTDEEAPACPECGGRSWSQGIGGPKYCNQCDFAPTDQHMDLISAIDSYWTSVKAVESGGESA